MPKTIFLHPVLTPVGPKREVKQWGFRQKKLEVEAQSVSGYRKRRDFFGSTSKGCFGQGGGEKAPCICKQNPDQRKTLGVKEGVFMDQPDRGLERWGTRGKKKRKRGERVEGCGQKWRSARRSSDREGKEVP